MSNKRPMFEIEFKSKVRRYFLPLLTFFNRKRHYVFSERKTILLIGQRGGANSEKKLCNKVGIQVPK